MAGWQPLDEVELLSALKDSIPPPLPPRNDPHTSTSPLATGLPIPGVQQQTATQDWLKEGSKSGNSKPPTKESPSNAVNNLKTMRATTQSRYKAILGEKNRIYYLKKFESFDQQGPGLKASWNWPAFLAFQGWALYRKMYGCFFALFGVFFLSGIFGNAGSPWLSVIVLLVPWIVFPIYADSLYHKSIMKKIAVAQLTVKEEPRLLEYLRHKGGVNTSWVWVFGGIGGIAIIGLLAGILIPMFADYRIQKPSPESIQYYSWVNPLTKLSAKIDAKWRYSIQTDKTSQSFVFSEQTGQASVILAAQQAAGVTLPDYVRAFQIQNAVLFNDLGKGVITEKDGRQAWNYFTITNKGGYVNVDIIQFGATFWRIVTICKVYIFNEFLHYSNLVDDLKISLWTTVR